MRHYKKGRKLGTSTSHTKAMKRSLVCSLFLNDRIKTVESRAKEIRGDVDKVVTWAKRGDLHSRRLAIAYLNDKELVREIFEKVDQGLFKDRPGGYTRIMKLGPRKGDNAPMVIMELVTEPVGKKKAKAEPKAAKKATPKKAAPKKASKAEELAEDLGFEADGTKAELEALDAVAEGEPAEKAAKKAKAEEEVAEALDAKEAAEAKADEPAEEAGAAEEAAKEEAEKAESEAAKDAEPGAPVDEESVERD